MGQKSGSSWAGWWWFRVPHESTNKMWLGLEDLPPAPSQGSSQGPETLITWASPRGAHIMAAGRVSGPKRQRESKTGAPVNFITSCNLIQHYFYTVYWLHRWILVVGEGGYTQVWIPGGGDHRWPSQSLAATACVQLILVPFPFRSTHLNSENSKSPTYEWVLFQECVC